MNPARSVLLALVLAVDIPACKEQAEKSDGVPVQALPSMSIRISADSSTTLEATIVNPSGREILIPGSGFEEDFIYGSYWYEHDKIINAPQCGTGFWDSMIRIPAGKTQELRLLVPRTTVLGRTYTIAVVYWGLGATAEDLDAESYSETEWVRHPDISLNCRKMEATVTLPKK